MRMLLCAIVFLSCFFSNGLLGVSAAELRIEKTFTKADGLASDRVLAILEDRNGVMWFGTPAGVSRYDGESFQTFTTQDGLADNGVGLIFEDSLGRIWFAPGVLATILARQKVADMSLMAMPLRELVKLPADKTPESIRSSIPKRGVSRYDAHGFRTFTTTDGLADNTVLDVFEDDVGRLWFATLSGVSRHDGETFDTLKMEGTIGKAVLPEYWNQVTAIAQDTAGNFWFASAAGITYYIAKNSVLLYLDVNFIAFQEMGEAETGHLTDLQFDALGNLWMSRETMSSESSGIRRYDGESVVVFPQSQAFPMNSVHHILQDREGHLWFCGVHKQQPTLQEAEDHVTRISAETFVGVSVYNGETFENFDTDERLPSNRVWSVFQDSNGKFWFATDAGVAVGVYHSCETPKERR